MRQRVHYQQVERAQRRLHGSRSVDEKSQRGQELEVVPICALHGVNRVAPGGGRCNRWLGRVQFIKAFHETCHAVKLVCLDVLGQPL